MKTIAFIGSPRKGGNSDRLVEYHPFVYPMKGTVCRRLMN